MSTTATASHLLKTVFVFGTFLFEPAMSVFPFLFGLRFDIFSISSWGTTEIDLVLLCLSLAATSQMHAHDVCVLSLLRLWDCGLIDAIVEIKKRDRVTVLAMDPGVALRAVGIFSIAISRPFGRTAWDLYMASCAQPFVRC